jgi:phycocyanobilin lyase beta subunit
MSTAIAPLLEAIEVAASADELLEAVEALAAARSVEAIPTLIATLAYNNPGAAVAAVDGLIQLGDIAVPSLLSLFDTFNYGARAWAIRALAGIGDPRGLDFLLDAARNDFALSVRRAAARGLGIIQWSKLSPDQQPLAQQRCLDVLKSAATDPEWVVRYAAITGLQQLANALHPATPLAVNIRAYLSERLLQEPTLAVQARIQLAQTTLASLCVSS